MKFRVVLSGSRRWLAFVRILLSDLLIKLLTESFVQCPGDCQALQGPDVSRNQPAVRGVDGAHPSDEYNAATMTMTARSRQ